MREAVEYLKHVASSGALEDPHWVIEGGFYHNPENSTYIGIVLSRNSREYYIPSSVKHLDASMLKGRQRSIAKVTSDVDNTALSILAADIDTWWIAKIVEVTE